VPTTAPTYTERLTVPLRWWVQGVMLIATLWLAVAVAAPAVAAALVALICVALMTWLFVSYGGAVVSVADGEFRAGRARIPTKFVGTVTELDQEATRLTAGRDADTRAFLVLRPYLKRSVRVELTDPQDPTPYWLVSTRHPDRLAAALGAGVNQ
jgi:hypothetical protein